MEIVPDTAALAGYERDVRRFAEQFQTPNVRRVVELCEAGRISWVDAWALARKALEAGLKEIGR